ncbi:MFS transporter [Streptomyces sp. NPDC020141]|uniref:MFS transporter n=1 Tax=Streptomyces sp. NPDC020141 TaxID=3365065 RepID=UPI0037B80144
MTGAGPDHRAPQRRERGALLAATLTHGPNELIDFVLPLWAGAALGLSATQIGLLLAVEMALSMIMRPVAGVLADRYERKTVAAAGAALYALSAAGYALAGSAPAAYAAAAVGGAGGALLWVAVRAMVSERLAVDSAVFARLLASQETGSWVAFVAGMTLIGLIDHRGVFLACAAACAVASVVLLRAPGRKDAAAAPEGRAGRAGPDERDGPGEGTASGAGAGAAAAGLGAVGRRLRPMLLAVAFTTTAEAAVSLLLLLHLQRGFGLDVTEIAFVFLPGAIAMSLAAERLHTVVVRFGRSRVLTAASLASAAFAAGLAWAPNPYAIAVLWVLSGLAWAAVTPIQQAVVAEASGERVGRGMGVYESASLLGALAGSLGAGVLYDGADWRVACLVTAAALLAGAVVVPRAVRRLGVADAPPAPLARERREATGPDAGPGAADGTVRAAEEQRARELRAQGLSAREHRAAAPEEPGQEPSLPGASEPSDPARRRTRGQGAHLALFTAAQLALAFAGLSWIADLFTEDLAETLVSGGGREQRLDDLLYGAGKIWALVLLAGAVWTGGARAASAVRDRVREKG